MAGYQQDPDYDRIRVEFTAKYGSMEEDNTPVAA